MYRVQALQVKGTYITSEWNIQGTDITSERNVQGTDVACERNAVLTLHYIVC